MGLGLQIKLRKLAIGQQADQCANAERSQGCQLVGEPIPTTRARHRCQAATGRWWYPVQLRLHHRRF
jgi:hypothetical protein